MVEYVVERVREVFGAGLVRRQQAVRQRDTVVVEELFGARLVLLGVELHRFDLVEVRRIGALDPRIVEGAGRECARAGPVPAGEHPREPLGLHLTKGRDRLTGGVVLYTAIEVQLHEADAEQLRQFARIVLIGTQVGVGGGATVAEHREVDAHRRMQRDVLEQRAEVAEGVARQHVVEISGGEGQIIERTHLRDHHDLRERESHALPQLVLAAQGIGEPLLLPEGIEGRRIEPGRYRSRVGGDDGGQQQLCRLGDLGVDPARIGVGHITQTDQPGRLGVGRAEGGLVEETEGLDFAEGRRRWHHGLGRCRRAATATTATGGEEAEHQRRQDRSYPRRWHRRPRCQDFSCKCIGGSTTDTAHDPPALAKEM